MSNKTMYKVLGVTITMLLLAIGIYVGIDLTKKDEMNINPVVVSNTDNVKIYDDEIKMIEDEYTDVFVKFVDIYPECGHSFEQEEHYEKTTKEKVKQELEDKNLTYKLVGEEDKYLIYQRVHDGICMNHYLVNLEDNVVKIYRTNKQGKYEIYQVTEITKEMLRDGIVEKLESGIYVDDIEELFLLIEDIES